MFFRIIILAALIRLLIATNNFWLCSGIYATLAAIGALIGGAGILGALISGAVALVLSSVYFWLLNRFEESFLFWIIMIVGLLIGVV
jgi:hypothetical protein